MRVLRVGKGLSRVLFWSVISAAFIGPGTVTVCFLSGSTYGSALLWVLSFSILATIVLQEAAARLTLASGKSLGEIIVHRHGLNARYLLWFLAGSVVLGCGAYEAGNILGGVAGIRLMLGWPEWVLSLLLGAAAFALLSIQSLASLLRWVGILVFLMGLAFVIIGVQSADSPGQVLFHAVVPTVPPESEFLLIGLMGTTIVPYNLFLGSGIGQDQTVAQMRQGLIPAVGIGGIISLSILLAGTLVEGEFSYANAAGVLSDQLGNYGRVLFALGLAGAGFTSAVTAPLAASITAKSLLATPARQSGFVGKGVLLFGVILGVSELKPVPVILAAQVANGLILPLVTWELYRCVNDASVLPKKYLNSVASNALLLTVFFVTLVVGGFAIAKLFF